MSIPSYSIASIPADGIGPEVIDAGIVALQALADTLNTFKLDFTHYDWSSETYKKTGKYIPDGACDWPSAKPSNNTQMCALQRSSAAHNPPSAIALVVISTGS